MQPGCWRSVTRLGVLAFGHSRQTQTLIEILTLREVHRIVAYCFGAVFGDGKIGHQTLGGGSQTCGGLCEQPGKCQRAGQDELGESPVRIDFDRFAHALRSREPLGPDRCRQGR